MIKNNEYSNYKSWQKLAWIEVVCWLSHFNRTSFDQLFSILLRSNQIHASHFLDCTRSLAPAYPALNPPLQPIYFQQLSNITVNFLDTGRLYVAAWLATTTPGHTPQGAAVHTQLAKWLGSICRPICRRTASRSMALPTRNRHPYHQNAFL